MPKVLCESSCKASSLTGATWGLIPYPFLGYQALYGNILWPKRSNQQKQGNHGISLQVNPHIKGLDPRLVEFWQRGARCGLGLPDPGAIALQRVS